MTVVLPKVPTAQESLHILFTPKTETWFYFTN